MLSLISFAAFEKLFLLLTIPLLVEIHLVLFSEVFSVFSSFFSSILSSPNNVFSTITSSSVAVSPILTPSKKQFLS